MAAVSLAEEFLGRSENLSPTEASNQSQTKITHIHILLKAFGKVFSWCCVGWVIGLSINLFKTVKTGI